MPALRGTLYRAMRQLFEGIPYGEPVNTRPQGAKLLPYMPWGLLDGDRLFELRIREELRRIKMRIKYIEFGKDGQAIKPIRSGNGNTASEALSMARVYIEKANRTGGAAMAIVTYPNNHFTKVESVHYRARYNSHILGVGQ